MAFDPDTLSEANMGRQLFSAADVGQNKAAELTHRVNMHFGLDWVAQSKRCGLAELLSVISGAFVIVCVGSAKARREIHHQCIDKKRDVYLLDLGNHASDGQAIFGHTQRGCGRFRIGIGTVYPLKCPNCEMLVVAVNADLINLAFRNSICIIDRDLFRGRRLPSVLPVSVPTDDIRPVPPIARDLSRLDGDIPTSVLEVHMCLPGSRKTVARSVVEPDGDTVLSERPDSPGLRL